MRKRGLAILGLALAGTEAGHLLAYQLRFGPDALRIQSTGVHAYFPALLKTTVGMAALTLVIGVLMVGAASLLSRGPGERRSSGGGFIGLLATLFTLQLACYMGQEVTESLVAGLPPDSASNLLLWGMVGQLPIALGGAAALRWLWTRVEEVASQLASVVGVCSPTPQPAQLAVAVVRDVEQALLLAHAARSRFVKRGPPIPSSTRAF